MMSAQRGHSIQAIAEKLLEVSPKAQENARRGDEGYALVTAQNAAGSGARPQAGQGVAAFCTKTDGGLTSIFMNTKPDNDHNEERSPPVKMS